MSSVAGQRERQASWRPWRAMLREVAARVPLHRGTTAVDVGCGTGEVVPLLRECGWDPIGVDFDAAMLTAAKSSHPGLRFEQLDVTDLNSRVLIGTVDSPVTLLWSSFCVQYFTSRLAEVMAGWSTLLSPDGVLAVVEIDGLFSCHFPLAPADAEAFRIVDTEVLPARGYNPFAARDVEAAMIACGLEPLETIEFSDPELSFDGPASAEIVNAWNARFARPKLRSMLVERFGDEETVRLQAAFLRCITSPDHVTCSKIRLVMARKPRTADPATTQLFDSSHS